MITVPSSGAVITDAAVEAMINAAVADANAIPAASLGPMGLNDRQMPSLVLGGATTRVEVTTTCNTQPPAFGESGVLWQEINDFRCNGAALGPCVLVLHAEAHIERFAIAAGAPAVDCQFWMMLYFRIDGVDTTVPLLARVGWSATGCEAVHQTLAVRFVINKTTSFTLDRIGCLFAKNAGGSFATAAAPNFTISNGLTWWLALRKAA